MMLRYMGWIEAADLIMNGVANTIANGELTFDLARLREAIHQPIRKDRPHDKQEVEQELEQLIPGATLVGTSGFGEAVIRHMDDDRAFWTGDFRQDCRDVRAWPSFLTRSTSAIRTTIAGRCRLSVTQRAISDRGPRARHARRQSDGPAVHRRSCGHPAVSDAAQVRLRLRDRVRSADDGLQLIDCRITNAVKCLPPDNKPVGAEINTCNSFLANELRAACQGGCAGAGRHRASGDCQGLRLTAGGFQIRACSGA